MKKLDFLKSFLKHVLFYFPILFFLPVQAKIFKNSYVQFEVPDTWKCTPFGTNWVCHDNFQPTEVEALITSTAKIASSLDTREQYLNYLKQEKTWFTNKKEQITSKKLTEAKEVFIHKYPWVDGIHKNSEVKSYISRYVGTVCCKDSSSQLGILIVLSAHEDHYKKYSAIFIKTINSLKVLDIEKAIPKVRASEAMNGAGDMTDYVEGLFDNSHEPPMDEEGFFGLKLSPTNLGLLALGLLALLVLFLKRKRKKGKQKRTQKRKRKRS